jgi:hypothetical protein
VYNCAIQVLKATFPDRPAFRVIEVPKARPSTDDAARPHGRRASDREPVAAKVAEAPAPRS